MPSPVTVVPSPDSDDARRISALLVNGERTVRVATTANVPLAGDATPWLAPATLIGMRNKRDVVVYGEVSETAVQGSVKAQGILGSWFPDILDEVTITTPMAVETTRSSGRRGVGAFFSGGVDSYYTTLKHVDEITHLIFIHGFDIDLSNNDLAERTLDALRKSAAELGKELIEVKTDLRGRLDRNRLNWGLQGHGALLAHVGIALSTVVEKIYVPSSYTADQLHPWGTHPDLDGHWSSDAVEFIHDGVEASRAAKMEKFIEEDAAMNNLRVCWWNQGNAYNCGECEKCLRTMINLYIAGGLERCATLPDKISIEAIDRLHFNRDAKLFVAENLAELRAGGIDDPELEAALQRVLDRSKFKDFTTMAKFVAIGVKNILTPQGVRFLIGLYRPALNKDLVA
ncbi:hypothetical protein [Williamsia sp. D3]|uniref:hypothetical protein n=1 Tax=Williamsia sp. D3 TaxID=1313067 RepID=UPI0003D2FF10|nr:hypothetical protein [Williamsia sp. D3]ETD30528.1 hypothetical protein W823_23600 [Williamsia sp. D3]